MSKNPLIVDAYSHIVPVKYLEAIRQISPKDYDRVSPIATLYNLEQRFRVMDMFEGTVQVLSLHRPVIQEISDTKKAAGIIQMANDEMAELVVKYPDRFVAAIAGLPMNNMDDAIKEADRTIRDLKFRGVMVHSNEDDKPLDSPEFLPLFEMMSRYGLPVYIHPHREPDDIPEYRSENTSKYHIYNTFGWPYETTAAMSRLVFGGILEKLPGLKVITHHCGGMVPYFAERIVQHYGVFKMGNRAPYLQALSKDPIEYFKMFYNDTAIHGNSPALSCACAFCGADHLLFGADFPWGDTEYGVITYRKTIKAIEDMTISDCDKKLIYEGNARRILHLD